MKFTLKDLARSVPSEIHGEVVHVQAAGTLLISLDGFSTKDAQFGPIIMLEFFGDKVQLCAWTDINVEEPVTICLNNAHESKYKGEK